MLSQRTLKQAVLLTFLLLAVSVYSKERTAQAAIPCEIPRSTLGKNSKQMDFDGYSWQVFIALNRPASRDHRGTPDCDLPYNFRGPKVWQTYKTSEDVFLENARPPGPWSAGYNHEAINRLGQVSKSAISRHMEAVGAWLIDQNKNPTYFQMRVNEQWYDYVVDHRLYDKDTFTNKTVVSMPDHSMEIKAAWRILTQDDKKSRYITQQSEVVEFNKNGLPILLRKEGERIEYKTKMVTLGLVGFHQVMKVPGFPQWLWATFEHVDNVPDSVYDPDTYTMKPAPEGTVNYAYYNAEATPDEVNQSPCSVSDPTDCQSFEIPTPLTRITPIRDEANKVNQKYQKLLSKLGRKGEMPTYPALMNYQLITTQWPQKPNNPAAVNGDPTPTISANTTMESYIQGSSNCMNCHGIATLPNTASKSDFSYLFNEAHSSSEGNK